MSNSRCHRCAWPIHRTRRVSANSGVFVPFSAPKLGKRRLETVTTEPHLNRWSASAHEKD
eukprot:348530-Rhodomonas_salina.1